MTGIDEAALDRAVRQFRVILFRARCVAADPFHDLNSKRLRWMITNFLSAIILAYRRELAAGQLTAANGLRASGPQNPAA